MSDPGDKSLARSLGEFFGHIFHGIKTDPSKRVVRREVESREQPVPGGKVVLRRTTVEEIEYRGNSDTPGPGPGAAGSSS